MKYHRIPSLFRMLIVLSLVCSGLLAVPHPARAAATRYVTPTGAGLGSCSTWTNACTLTAALAAAAAGDEIWVAAGTYKPTGGADRAATFTLKEGVAVYGGFAGGETTRDQRDRAAHPAVLSGEIGAVGDKTDNSYKVVTGSGGLTAATVLDGFTLTAGNADNGQGGGMYLWDSSPTLANLTFTANTAVFAGGGMYLHASSPTLTNLVFVANTTTSRGGGMYLDASSPTLTNVTFSANSAEYGGGIFLQGSSSPAIRNSILWGNTAAGDFFSAQIGGLGAEISYSLVQDQPGGTNGNLNGTNPANDPLFVDLAGGDLRLRPTSPVINKGSSAVTGPALPAADRDGLARIWGGTVDLGAYEFNGRLYVNAAASGSQNGSSWSQAFTSLQSAIAAANPAYEIWVAAGTYRPTGGADRTAAFTLKEGVAIYGGFAGSEAVRDQRDWAAHPTLLSGDIGAVGNDADNSYHVVSGSGGLSAATVLDGFTLTAGNADDFENSVFFGGGIFLQNSSPTLANLTFDANYAHFGGGMYLANGSPTLTSITFSANTAASGGGMYLASSSPILTNLVFSGNTASTSGGGMYLSDSSPTLTNATFGGNSAFYGGGIYLNGASPAIRNSILWGNTAANESAGAQISGGGAVISYSLVQGQAGGANGNLDGTNPANDPLFIDLPGGNLRLRPTSPVIDKGSSTVTGPALPAADRDGIARIWGSAVDLGAYENRSPIHVNAAVSGGTGDGSSWANAFPELRDALGAAVSGSQIWAAAGTYKPTGGGDRAAAFTLKEGVAIYGGFAGSETARDQRDWTAHPTLLSGDIGAVGNSADNSLHVVYGSGGLTAATVLDGFTITAGNTDNHFGGGMFLAFSSPTLANLIFSANSADQGGGIFMGDSSPTLTNVNFSANSALDGGGMYVLRSSPTLIDLTFSANKASFEGGGMHLRDSSPTLFNATFTANSAGYGGGMYLRYGYPTLTNIILSANSAGYGGGIYQEFSIPTLYNSIFWGNTAANEPPSAQISGGAAISCALIQGGFAGRTDILNADPLFVRAPSPGADGSWNGVNDDYGDLRLRSASPAVNQGCNAYLPAGSLDLAGLPRVVDTTVDLGAYENQAPNHAPVLTALTGWNLSENPAVNPGQTVEALLSGRVTDADGTAAAASMAVYAADSTHGAWQTSPDGSSWTALGSVSAASAVLLGPSVHLRFAPNADWNGTAVLSLRAWDGADGRSSGDTGVSLAFNGANSAFSSAAVDLSVTVLPPFLLYLPRISQ